MRYAVILAGGAGTRLWPMSVKEQPKQLIPFIDGKSLLEIAFSRLDGLVPEENRFICASNDHKQVIVEGVPGMQEENFLGEPVGRDTVNALAYCAAVIAKKDPDAVIAVFTADHIIRPVEEFLSIIETGYEIVEAGNDTLLTFGITPDHGATGFGYLELADDFLKGSKELKEFKEKPDVETADSFFRAGPDKYLWNSGMFVWRAKTFMNCIRRYEPEVGASIDEIAAAWGTSKEAETLSRIYPTLKKISVDFAVMEPASKDPDITVAALPMPLEWIDVGSWTAYGDICGEDPDGNKIAAGAYVNKDCGGNIVVSNEADHLVATLGCQDLIIIHTGKATLICDKNKAQDIKELHSLVGEKFGERFI